MFMINYNPISPVSITLLEDDGTKKEVITFQNSHGYILTKEEYLDKLEKTKIILQKACEFYEGDDLKRNWSFKCDWCGNKVSSKTDKEYYSLRFPQLPHKIERNSFERGCTKECATHIWFDLFKE